MIICDRNQIAPEEWSERWPNFSAYELACRSDGTLIVSTEFLDELQRLRNVLKKPMHITSGCRTKAHNARIGGKAQSFHICDDENGRGQEGTLAVDVAATEGLYRGDLFEQAWKVGWSIGWNATKGFLHLDRRIEVGWRQTSFDY